MVRRIAALLLLDPQLDANYLAVKADLYEWPREEEATVQSQVPARNPLIKLRAHSSNVTASAPDSFQSRCHSASYSAATGGSCKTTTSQHSCSLPRPCS